MNETLTQALARHGLAHRDHVKHSCRQLTQSGTDVGEPMPASTGWVLVRLLDRDGISDVAAQVQRAFALEARARR